MSLNLTTLFSVETKDAILEKGLAIASALGLPVTSWRPGDPTRSLYHYVAEILGSFESVVAQFIRSGFLDYAEGDWLTLLAEQVYGLRRIEATAAGGELYLYNGGGGYYEWAAGDLSFKASATGKTYHSTTALTLASGELGLVSFVADDAGSDYAAAAGEVDELVTSALGIVVVTSANIGTVPSEAGSPEISSSALATDEQSDPALRAACRTSLGALSPNGPLDAYEFIATSPEYLGSLAVARARALDDPAGNGGVLVYIAGAAGPITDGDGSIEAALARWATPLGISPQLIPASAGSRSFTITLYVHDTIGEPEAVIVAAVEADELALFAATPIGGNGVVGATGYLHKTLIESVARETYREHVYRVESTVSDIELDRSEFPTIESLTVVVVGL